MTIQTPTGHTAIGTERLSGEAAVWSALRSVQAQTDAQLDRALHRVCSIGLTEFLALLACAEAPDGEVRMNELSEAVGITQGSGSRLVVRLERAGLTERRMCEYDRRGVYTAITVHGRNVLDQAVPAYEHALQQALNRFATDERFAPLIQSLRALPDRQEV
jgi:DNA-binding MarR family transcriptional regulator